MLLVLVLTFMFILIDIVSKLMIINNFNLYDKLEIIPNFFDITYIKNYGGAFNVLDGSRWFFIILAIITIAFIIKFILLDKNITKFERVSYSLILSGIVGNLIDRIIYGGVIDFLSFSIFGYDFAVFNLADSFIVVGVFLVVIKLLFIGDKNENIRSR